MPKKAKSLCVEDLRHAEYYGMQPVFDDLYQRSKDGEIHRFGAGVALLAAMSGAPVVPAAIIGTDKMKGLRVIYGEPMRFEGKSDREALDAFSEKIREEIIKMKNFHSKK